MKKIQLLPVLLLIAAISVANSISAQASFHAPKIFKEPAVGEANSKDSKISKADLNFRIMKRFTRSFPVITDESWEKIPKGFMVRFNENGISTSAFLNNGGFCDATIRYYDETKLPPDVRTLVRSSYFDYSIRGVTEVTYYSHPEDSTKAYLVTIDNLDSWKIIRVADGDMDVYQSFSK